MSFKIHSLTTYSKGQNLVIVKALTDSGIAGYGECSGMYASATIDIIKRHIEPAIKGMSIFDLESIVQKAFRQKYKFYGQLLAMSFSGVELALWDAQGKALGQPVYNLLGGRYRGKIEYYASSMSRDLSPKQEAEKVAAAIQRYGFKALKVKVGARMSQTNGICDAALDVEKVRAVRAAVGPGIKIMIDGNSSFTWFQALQFFDLVRKYDILAFEEPCPFKDIESHAKLQSYLGVPINLGEQEWDLFQIKRMIASGACQILALDASKCGGLTMMKKSAALCEAFGILQAPHNTSRRINLYATMHFAAATPSCAFYQEFSIEQGTGADPFMVDACLPTDGTIVVPDAPGFGVTLDEKQLHETLDVL